MSKEKLTTKDIRRATRAGVKSANKEQKELMSKTKTWLDNRFHRHFKIIRSLGMEVFTIRDTGDEAHWRSIKQFISTLLSEQKKEFEKVLKEVVGEEDNLNRWKIIKRLKERGYDIK